MAQPVLSALVREMAEHAGVCISPLAIRKIDLQTGQATIADAPCGARMASKCKPCAERNRRLRQIQIREGWHLTEEPSVAQEKPTAEVQALLRLRCALLYDRAQCEADESWPQVRELDRAIAEVDELLAGCRTRGTLPKPGRHRKPRTVRSTKRRQDAPKLPRRPVENRSLGRVFTSSRTGKQHCPSMLLTTTLLGFGEVHTGKRMRRGQLAACGCGQLHGEADPLLGTPLDPEAYDYREHAVALIFYPYLLDRFWQNYRRATGMKLAYAGTVEMQRRLATHTHYAVRGTVPRALTKQVAAATYHQVWWPPFDSMVYSPDRPPVWDDNPDVHAYVDPRTRQPLPTWAEAIAELSTPDARPAHVVRMGSVDVRGIEGGTPAAERTIRYATKYLTKDLVDQTLIRSDPQRAHADQLYRQLQVLPCSPRCANWLLYGVQPDRAGPDLMPGRCRGKVHQRKTLGYTGRRCLVSRNWSGKTLTDHRLDGRDWFRALTAGVLDHGEDQADNAEPVEKGRYIYQLARRDDRDVDNLTDRIMRSIEARQRARLALRLVREGPPGAVPATPPPLAQAA